MQFFKYGHFQNSLKYIFFAKSFNKKVIENTDFKCSLFQHS